MGPSPSWGLWAWGGGPNAGGLARLARMTRLARSASLARLARLEVGQVGLIDQIGQVGQGAWTRSMEETHGGGAQWRRMEEARGGRRRMERVHGVGVWRARPLLWLLMLLMVFVILPAISSSS